MKQFKTITEFLAFRGLPKPQHPLFSVLDASLVKQLHPNEPPALVFDFYSIAVKRAANLRARYGQQPLDFTEGLLSFVAPGQVVSVGLEEEEAEIKQTGWLLFIHPDFLWNTPLASTIRQYDFWDYSVHEALFLSASEEAVIYGLIRGIQQEYQTNIDRFSQRIVVSQLETLLSYAERFYSRQFITRSKAHHQVLERLEKLLDACFAGPGPVERGLPTVQAIAEQLHLSPKYLSGLLQSLTGQNTQQHIHTKLLAKAKEKLSATHLSVSEIAYELGFEHAPSFSKLFKKKTGLSPLAFRQSFH